MQQGFFIGHWGVGANACVNVYELSVEGCDEQPPAFNAQDDEQYYMGVDDLFFFFEEQVQWNSHVQTNNLFMVSDQQSSYPDSSDSIGPPTSSPVSRY
jgi:hypothetical protein